MEIKITNKKIDDKMQTDVEFVVSKRKFSYVEAPEELITTSDKMDIKELIKSVYLAGKNDDVLFMETENNGN